MNATGTNRLTFITAKPTAPGGPTDRLLHQSPLGRRPRKTIQTGTKNGLRLTRAGPSGHGGLSPTRVSQKRYLPGLPNLKAVRTQGGPHQNIGVTFLAYLTLQAETAYKNTYYNRIEVTFRAYLT